MVALYMRFCAGDGTPVGDVVSAAQHLVDGFAAANRRSGVRENPSLGVIPGPRSSPPALSEETGGRIARALEAIVGLLARANGEQNPLDESDSDSDDS